MSTIYQLQAYGRGHQRVVHHFQGSGFPADTITPNESFAFVSVCEQNGNSPPFIGAARMYVCNVVVGVGYIDIWIQIDWNSDLNYNLNILLANR